MRKAQVVAALFLLLAFSFSGCAVKSSINSYVLPGSQLGGDAEKGIPPLENVLIWPMVNVAAGGKSKGVELQLTDYLIDTVYLRNSFKSVYILTEEESKDLMARAGEELGLKKKPKDPNQGGLITTKLGQMTGTEGVLMGRLDEYDEVKVEKQTFSGVGMSFFLYDAREQSYPTLDSFTPSKTLWRMNAARAAQETAFQARASLWSTARRLIVQVIAQLEKDFKEGTARYRKAQEQKIRELGRQADQQRKAEQYDEAVATWNEVLQIDPNYSEAKKQIERIEEEKRESEEREKERQRQEEISGIRQKALELQEAGELEAAKGEWAKIIELDPENREASSSMETLDAEIAAMEAADREKELSANLHLAQKALGEAKYTEAIDAAKKVLAVDPGNEKAEDIVRVAEQKLEEARAAEGEVTTTPAAPPPAPEPPPPAVEEEPKEAPAAAPAPAAAGVSEVEKLRNQAMEFFNAEQYEKAEEAWKKILEVAPDDKQAQEMLETTQMLIEALK